MSKCSCLGEKHPANQLSSLWLQDPQAGRSPWAAGRLSSRLCPPRDRPCVLGPPACPFSPLFALPSSQTYLPNCCLEVGQPGRLCLALLSASSRSSQHQVVTMQVPGSMDKAMGQPWTRISPAGRSRVVSTCTHTLVSEREANCSFPLEETFPGEKCPPEVESSRATLSRHRGGTYEALVFSGCKFSLVGHFRPSLAVWTLCQWCGSEHQGISSLCDPRSALDP